MSNELSIKLLNERSVWLPSDEILGEVHLVCSGQVNVIDISIAFQGKAETQISESQSSLHKMIRTSTIPLFSLNKVLFQGPFTLSPGSLSWPFRFIIPQNCGGSSEEGVESMQSPNSLREEPTFDFSRKQLLPPTFPDNLESASGCKIEYTLQAVMHDNKSFSKARKTTLQIRIAQPRLREPEQFERRQSPHDFSFHTMHLNSEVSDRGPTLKERMRMTFSPEKIPTVNLKVVVELPQAVVANGPVNPILHLQHSREGTAGADSPEVLLTEFSLGIKAEIFSRTKSNKPIWSTSMRQLDQWSNEVGVPLTERFEAAELFSNGLIMPTIAPTFRTFNIAVRYQWTVKFTVMCAAKKRSGKFSMPCIVLGPPGHAPPAVFSVEEELLPAYTRPEQNIEVEPPGNSTGLVS